MKGMKPDTVVMAFAIAAVALGCSSSGARSARGCDSGGGCPSGSACVEDACEQFAVCPAGLEATFESIRASVLEMSCGSEGSICHSSAGGTDSGQLILADDPYGALLGPGGTGEPASNISGSVRDLRRVVPGDPDHSFLVLKLTTKTLDDPRYGAGMPRTDPGSVCPPALQAIRDWIEAGAER